MADNSSQELRTTRLRSGKTIGGDRHRADPNGDSKQHKSSGGNNHHKSGGAGFEATDKSIINSNNSHNKRTSGDNNGLKDNGIASTAAADDGRKEVVNGFHNSSNVSKNNNELDKYISSLVLWRRPVSTVYYATHELIHQLISLFKWVLRHTKTCLLVIVVVMALLGASYVDGPHQQWVHLFRKQFLWCAYWCGLGILSSVGLGTGLHTFLLYLGPHIASVTLAAYECDSLDFPSPPYPDEIICPVPTPGVHPVTTIAITVWSIMSKVRLEAFMWGAGTALGELPPYFVARAHRLAGEDEEELDADLAEEIAGGSETLGAVGTAGASGGGQRSLAQRFRSNMIRLVTKVGFFGILACASIPNPLFDLAGITCGYSLVPFWTFFGATLIGKAVIKMHIQKLFVIVAFNENYVDLFVQKSRSIPYVGQYLHEPLREFLAKQKASLHRGSAKHTVKESSWLSTIFEWVVISMLVYFAVSIVNSMAQNNQKRRLKEAQHSAPESGDPLLAGGSHRNTAKHLKSK